MPPVLTYADAMETVDGKVGKEYLDVTRIAGTIMRTASCSFFKERAGELNLKPRFFSRLDPNYWDCLDSP